jgi:hypothetical protein
MTNPESRGVGLEELAPSADAEAIENDENQIAEADIRELSAYAFDSDDETLVGMGLSVPPDSSVRHFPSDDRTLVGIGPSERVARSDRVSRPRRSAPAHDGPRRAASAPDSSRMPPSEPPGPFVVADHAEKPPALPLKKGGAWALVLSALLVAAGAVAFVRGIQLNSTAEGRGSAPLGELQPAATAAPTAGLEVVTEGASPHVLVDGVDRGTPPLRIDGLEPGPHVVAIVDPAYAPYSETLSLTANQVTTVEPRVAFLRGAIHLSGGEGAEGAEVEVVGEKERRDVHRLPATLEVAPGEYRIRAEHLGYKPFEGTALLSATNPVVEIQVALLPDPTQGARALKPAVNNPTLPPSTKKLEGVEALLGSLDITSNPPASVVLDGRPLGKAPQIVPVSSGLHTVVFVHPERGRLLLSVNVTAGQTTRASADF